MSTTDKYKHFKPVTYHSSALGIDIILPRKALSNVLVVAGVVKSTGGYAMGRIDFITSLRNKNPKIQSAEIRKFWDELVKLAGEKNSPLIDLFAQMTKEGSKKTAKQGRDGRS